MNKIWKGHFDLQEFLMDVFSNLFFIDDTYDYDRDRKDSVPQMVHKDVPNLNELNDLTYYGSDQSGWEILPYDAYRKFAKLQIQLMYLSAITKIRSPEPLKKMDQATFIKRFSKISDGALKELKSLDTDVYEDRILLIIKYINELKEMLQC